MAVQFLQGFGDFHRMTQNKYETWLYIELFQDPVPQGQEPAHAGVLDSKGPVLVEKLVSQNI